MQVKINYEENKLNYQDKSNKIYFLNFLNFILFLFFKKHLKIDLSANLKLLEKTEKVKIGFMLYVTHFLNFKKTLQSLFCKQQKENFSSLVIFV